MHFCLYYGKSYRRIARHLQNIHHDEDEVKCLKNLYSKKKSHKLDELRGRGDFHKNMKVLQTGGELVVRKIRSSEKIVKATDYLPCEHCLIKAELSRHRKKCPLKKGSNSGDIVKRAPVLLYSNQYGEGASEELKKHILQNMNHDKIISVVRKDKLILAYGSFMLSSSGIKGANGISQGMRMLAN